ncbi:MAG: oligosaccharide flippase family protein [Bacteroidales bacterium]|jgi:O-antigen/teichoic acid export membrane protein|nr:oligosaccharide flippase family protein [Bacteroidales bacterium]
MSDITTLAKQTAIYGIPTIVGRFLNYFLVPLYTYNIATQNYGIVSELYAYIAFLMVILTYGMETAFFRYWQTENNKQIVYNTALLSLIVSTSLFIIITFLFINPISSLLEYENHKNYIVLFLLILALDALRAIPYALLRQLQKAKRFAFIKTMDIFSNIAFNLFFILLCPILYKNQNILFSWFNPNDLVLYIFVSNLLASLIACLLLLPEFLKFRYNVSFSLLKKMLIYGFPVMIGGLAGMINETFDRIALKHIISVPSNITDAKDVMDYKMSQLGIYGACYKLSIIISLFIQAFKFAAEPFFFSKMKKEDAKKTYSNVMTFFVMFLSLVFLGVMGYMDIFKYFIGQDYRIGLKVVPILLGANIFLGIYYNLSIWYKVTDKTKFGAIISIIGAVITLTLNYVLIPIFGYMGAGWTTFICYFSIAIICYFLGQKFYKINYNIKHIIIYMFSALILFIIMYNVKINNSILSILFNTILILIFIIEAYFLDIRKLIIQKK